MRAKALQPRNVIRLRVTDLPEPVCKMMADGDSDQVPAWSLGEQMSHQLDPSKLQADSLPSATSFYPDLHWFFSGRPLEQPNAHADSSKKQGCC